jgi:Holliday junction resolvase RusA-like endonuclease
VVIIEGPTVEFRLVYQGALKAATGSNSRVREKHLIRKEFHKQLALLWESIPHLKNRKQYYDHGETGVSSTKLEKVARKFDRCGYLFVPLASATLSLACALDILFLRRDMPGVPLIKSGGDIDNRLKTLLDALRVPLTCDEISGDKDPSEAPYFYCLLEDDSQITEININTDRLLTPLVENQHEHEVLLVINVKLRPIDTDFDNLDFV